MREIGGYIELDRYAQPMLHEGALALNCGRNCLAYLIRARGIRKILLPYFLCGSVEEVCRREGAEVRRYHIGMDFMPADIALQEDEWLYVVNYYGQLDNGELSRLAHKHLRVIVDNAQAYFQMPVAGTDTLYTCRKFFGVADGAFLYTDAIWEEGLPVDESYGRMRFLLGRYERTASEFYPEYIENNRLFAGEPIKHMSKLTENLLHGIDYDAVEKRRTDNFLSLHRELGEWNQLKLSVPKGAFMYPLYVMDGSEIRKELQAMKIYIPELWPDIYDICTEDDVECDMARNILPIPIDQRYRAEEMRYLTKEVLGLMKKRQIRIGGGKGLRRELGARSITLSNLSRFITPLAA